MKTNQSGFLKFSDLQRAFTLNELLVSVAIIGILSTIAIPAATDAILKARIAYTQQNLRQISVAIESFAADRGHYPFGSNEAPTQFLTNYDSQEALKPLVGTYLPNNPSILLDPFTQSAAELINQSVALEDHFAPNIFGFGYYDYTHFMVPPRPPIRGYGIISFGPDETDSSLALTVLPGIGSLYQDAIYQPSNGLRSDGDIGRFGGNLSFPQSIP